MPVQKILERIREQIIEITPALESFADETVHPGVEQCSTLQTSLHGLLEQLAVYKYNKEHQELSPSFNLHAHISELSPPDDITESDKSVNKKETDTQNPPDINPVQTMVSGRPLQIGVNDKFRFINELFAHNDSEYNIAMEQLTNLKTWSESDLYLNSLKNLYGWDENHEAVKYFCNLVKKRFQ